MIDKNICKDREWENSYLEDLIAALKPFGDVLQVGFNYGSTLIQRYHPKSHVIIEPDPQSAKEARVWAKEHPHVSIIEDKWQNALASLPIFDTIFFHDELLRNEIEMLVNSSLGNEVLALHRGKELSSMVEKKIPHLTSLRYSDRDIDEFYEQVGQFQLSALSLFLSELQQKGQITEEQYEKFVQKYSIEKVPTKFSYLEKRQDPLFAFLQECLTDHMHKGSRFSAFLFHPTSKYENPQFFEHIITNPDLDYQEKLCPVKTPSEQYKFKETLVMTIEKLG